MTKRALISVANKEGIEIFARGLVDLGYEIISTGGTLRTLQKADVPAIAVDEVTGFPEILDGRVKTLHPFIHGGLLADASNENHMEQLQEMGIQPIDVVVANLYPFKETLQNTDASSKDIIENIDIGGPSMLRAAAKNAESTLVIVDPDDYTPVLEMMKADDITFQKRQEMAAKVFRHTAQYDVLIADYFTEQTGTVFPETYSVTYEKVQGLRYGENPHQQAAFYEEPLSKHIGISSAKQLHGKELSYNNIQDANAALEILSEFNTPAAVALKHMNPCGVGVGKTLYDAFEKAYLGDTTSIFGGIVALNREVDADVADKLAAIFLEIVIAPSFSEDALERLTEKKNIRLLTIDMEKEEAPYKKIVTVKGGALIQENDWKDIHTDDLNVPTTRKPTEKEMTDLLFAEKVVTHVKSNAIVLVKDGQTIGVGAGQMNRVGAAKIAIEQAGEKARGAVVASDAFFPMPDTVEACAKAGVTAIIQPGGSKKDQESIDSCDSNGIAMVFTGTRHFKH